MTGMPFSRTASRMGFRLPPAALTSTDGISFHREREERKSSRTPNWMAASSRYPKFHAAPPARQRLMI